MGRGRGRPQEVVHRGLGEGKPLHERASQMQATSRTILEAAHRLLVGDGIKAVTMAGVARAAYVDVTTVTYHFRTREGLIEALMDYLYAEPIADLVEEARDLPDVQDRWHACLQAVRRMYRPDGAATGTAPDTQAYFDIAAHALRTPSLCARLATLQNWKVEAFLAELASDDVPSVAALGQFIFAAIDGIELHQAIDPDGFPVEAVLGLLEELVAGQISARTGN